MSDIDYIAPLPRAELRSELRRRGGLGSSVRVLAEDLLGAGSTIDFVVADRDGAVVLVLIGEEGGDLALFTRALAQRAWVAPRMRDWLQLAPSLGIESDAPVRLSLLCPSYSPETIAAASALGAEQIELSTYRCVRNGSASTVLVERLDRAGAPAPAPADSSPSSRARFRSGLTEEDLSLTPAEIRDLGTAS